MTEPLAYDLNEAARVAGVSVQSLRRANDAGLLTFRYPTSKPVVKRADLEAWIDSAPIDSRRAS